MLHQHIPQELISHQSTTTSASMISQILLLVIATAACVNAYPSAEVAGFLEQLETQKSTVETQQSLSLCSSFPYRVTVNGVTYEFRDCRVMGGVCQYNRVQLPPACTISFACYDIEWIINGHGIERFQMCPTAGGACIQNFGLMRCGDKIEEQAQQQTVRLCQGRPDGSQNCVDDVQAVQVQQESGCMCITSAEGNRVCEPRDCRESLHA